MDTHEGSSVELRDFHGVVDGGLGGVPDDLPGIYDSPRRGRASKSQKPNRFQLPPFQNQRIIQIDREIDGWMDG